MAFEALDEGVGIHDGAGDLAEDVGVGLDLGAEAGGQVGEVVEGAVEVLGQDGKVGVGVGEGGLGGAEGILELLVDIGGEEPFAEGAGLARVGR